MSLLSIGGSDSGGGAGIQADLKTFGALGHLGASAVTCVTAQSTRGVRRIDPVPVEGVRAQVEAVAEDFDVAAVKTGALPTPELVEVVAASALDAPLVVDPVVAAEAGGALSTDASLASVKEHLLPRARVVTPNRPEAAALTGSAVETVEDAAEAGRALLELGADAAVVTGGHGAGGADDVVVTRDEVEVVRGERVEGRFHGTGCTFSAALAARLGEGDPVTEAARFAKRFTLEAIRGAHRAGSGPLPVEPLAWLDR